VIFHVFVIKVLFHCAALKKDFFILILEVRGMEEESSTMADSKEIQKEIVNEDSDNPLIKVQ
jgi:hypothetical protein